jgi:hypothetical protein
MRKTYGLKIPLSAVTLAVDHKNASVFPNAVLLFPVNVTIDMDCHGR